MTRQQIIEESNYLAIQFADADIDVRDAIKIGFQYAANWRIDSVWHDKDENPKFKGKVEKEGLLLLYSFGQCVLLYLDKDEWEHLLSYATFVKWAYIDDLLPQGKEEE